MGTQTPAPAPAQPASCPSLSLRTLTQRPRYNGEPDCPGQLQGLARELEDQQSAGDPTPQLTFLLQRRRDQTSFPRSPESREWPQDPHPAERLGTQR